MTRRSARTVLLAALLVAALAAGTPVSADDHTADSLDVTDLGTNHPLAVNATADEYTRTGYVEGSLERYRIEFAASESGNDVGLSPSIMRDTRNDYLRITYNESHTRTIRVLLPRSYITPYTMERVESYTGDHTASYAPARGGDYLAVTITFDGPGEAVLPLQKDSSVGGALLESVDRRVKQLTGFSPMGRTGKWQYLDGDEVNSKAAFPVNATSDDVLIQYDARPNEPDEVWVNAPLGESSKAPLYYFERDSDQQLYIVSAADTNPDVRLKTEPSRTDRIRGDINDIKLVPDRIRENAGDYWPF